MPDDRIPKESTDLTPGFAESESPRTGGSRIGPLPKDPRSYRYRFDVRQRIEIFRQAAPYLAEEGGAILDDFCARLDNVLYGVDLSFEEDGRYVGGYTKKTYNDAEEAITVQEYINGRRNENQRNYQNIGPIKLPRLGGGDRLRRGPFGEFVPSRDGKPVDLLGGIQGKGAAAPTDGGFGKPSDG